MANLTLSGYLTTAATGLSTQMDSLADNYWSALGSEIDNSTNKYALADLDLVLGSAAFTGTDSGIEVYIVPTIDGTNYPTWTTGGSGADEQENQPYFVCFLPTTGTTAAQRVTTPVHAPVPLPNGKFKFGIRSRANVALASSGNTLYYRPHSVAI